MADNPLSQNPHSTKFSLLAPLGSHQPRPENCYFCVLYPQTQDAFRTVPKASLSLQLLKTAQNLLSELLGKSSIYFPSPSPNCSQRLIERMSRPPLRPETSVELSHKPHL
jgi:hypothetical protein